MPTITKRQSERMKKAADDAAHMSAEFQPYIKAKKYRALPAKGLWQSEPENIVFYVKRSVKPKQNDR